MLLLAMAPETESLIRTVLMVCMACAGLLIPVALVLLVVLFQVVFLLHSVSELLVVVRYELFPIIKELRLTVDHVEAISRRTSDGIRDVSDSIRQIKPMFTVGLTKTKVLAQALLAGIGRSFRFRRPMS